MSMKLDKKGKPTFPKPSDELRQAARKVRERIVAKMSLPPEAREMRDPLLTSEFLPILIEDAARIRALLAHYKIPFNPQMSLLEEPRAMARLARELARDLIPNFDVMNGPGRKKERPTDFDDRLVKRVSEICAGNARLSIEGACRTLVKTKEWAAYSWSTLEARYHEGRARIAERERLLNEHVNAMHEAAVEDRKRAEEDVNGYRKALADALQGKPVTVPPRGLLSDLSSHFTPAAPATGKDGE